MQQIISGTPRSIPFVVRIRAFLAGSLWQPFWYVLVVLSPFAWIVWNSPARGEINSYLHGTRYVDAYAVESAPVRETPLDGSTYRTDWKYQVSSRTYHFQMEGYDYEPSDRPMVLSYQESDPSHAKWLGLREDPFRRATRDIWKPSAAVILLSVLVIYLLVRGLRRSILTIQLLGNGVITEPISTERRAVGSFGSSPHGRESEREGTFLRCTCSYAAEDGVERQVRADFDAPVLKTEVGDPHLIDGVKVLYNANKPQNSIVVGPLIGVTTVDDDGRVQPVEITTLARAFILPIVLILENWALYWVFMLRHTS